MFQNLSFKKKLILLCVFMSAITILVGITSYISLHKVEESYERVTNTSMPNLEKANQSLASYRRIRILLRTLGIQGISKTEADLAQKQVLEEIENYEKINAEYAALPHLPARVPLFNELQVQWKHFRGVGEQVIALYKSGKPEDHEKMIKIFFSDCPEAAKNYTAAINKLLEFHNAGAAKFVKEAEASADLANTLILLTALFGTIAGISIGLYFAVTITRSVNLVIGNLQESANQVTSASSSVSSAAQSLSQSATEQAASLEETAASLEEISSMIAKASDGALNTANSSSESQKKAEEGSRAVSQMMNSMNEISQSNDAIMGQINHSNQQMTEIVGVIQNIGQKTKVINDIVFQTKLLSFNASVEAARAGEHGKGFAVVAEEVGNLAQMSGNAAKEITEMLDSSITKVEGIVAETKRSVEELIAQGKLKVESGVETAKNCAGVLDEIVKNVSTVSGLAQEISSASKEQAQGVGEINKAMSQLDSVTQQNAATSEEAASSAEELLAQAESMKSVVSDLVKIIEGGSGQESKYAAAPERKATKIVSSGNVVQLKKSEPAAKAERVKSAVGDGSIPDRNHNGFREV